MPWPEDPYGAPPIDQFPAPPLQDFPVAGGIPPQEPVAEPWSWVPDSWRTGFPPEANGPELETFLASQNGPFPGGPTGPLDALPPLQPSEPAFQMPEWFGGAPQEPPPPEPAPSPASFGPQPQAFGPQTGFPASPSAQAAPAGAQPGPFGPAPAPGQAPAPVASDNPYKNPALSIAQRGQALADLHQRDPEKWLEYELQREDEIRQLTADRERDAAERNVAMEEQVARDRQAAAQRAADATAKIDAEATALAAEHPPRWVDKGAGQKIAGFLMAIGGGLMQSRTGGRNLGLEAVNQQIEQEVSTWQAEMSHRRDLLGQRRANVGDRLKADNAIADATDLYRLSLYKHVEQQLQTQRDQYDQAGTKARTLGQAILESRQHQAEARQALHDRKVKEEIALADAGLKLRKQAEDERAAKVKEQNERNQLGLGYSRLSFDKTKQAEDADLHRQDLAAKKAEAAQVKADKADEAQAKQDLELGVGGGRRKIVTPQLVPDPVTGKLETRQVVSYEDTPLIDKKTGKPWHAPDPARATKLQIQAVGTQDLVDALGDLRDLRDSAGGSNKLTSPGDQAKYKTFVNRIAIAYANSKGMSLADEQSQNFARDAVIGGDPSGYNIGDAIGRIDKAAEDATKSYHNALRFSKYTGDLPQFDRRPGAAKLSDAEKASEAIQQDRTPAERAADVGPSGTPLARRALERGFNPFGESPSERREADARASGGAIEGLTEKQSTQAARLLADAAVTGSDEPSIKKRDDARRELLQLATSPRADLRRPMLDLLESSAPDIYAVALSRAPEGERAAREQAERSGAIRALQQASTADVELLARTGQQDAIAELHRRADVEVAARKVDDRLAGEKAQTDATRAAAGAWARGLPGGGR